MYVGLCAYVGYTMSIYVCLCVGTICIHVRMYINLGYHLDLLNAVK